ncbi:antibiotic biosynthesis monooxygenase family protein [Radiobacillus deserti]|uniref:Antibiotic biosynthesis monooxygenase n=1 Tax=Radiobacillus deserti TaxID=2594883 RepID=A0A516KK41_9BACI|nr:antibiotic biosynthesis monooxygenase [Radiobacillus deserti]QDP41755.1 antibiotic biosynthesis monooxygenase [Radiobacillus deserti]
MTSNTNQVILNIRFKVKLSKKEIFRNSLYSLVEVMSKKSTFINDIISDDIEKPDDLVIHEIWQGTKDSWLQEELPKPYRKKHEEILGDLLEDRIVSYLTPKGEWGSNLTNVSRKFKNGFIVN